MFYQNFIRLCNERKVSPNAVASSIGISNGTATGWKNGAVPQQRTLIKIADYFGVPLETLTEEKSTSDSEASALTIRMEQLLKQLTPDQIEFLVILTERILETQMKKEII